MCMCVCLHALNFICIYIVQSRYYTQIYFLPEKKNTVDKMSKLISFITLNIFIVFTLADDANLRVELKGHGPCSATTGL
jgi:hypothetical protein